MQSIAFSYEKVVIWGHKLHTHTHSYIHNAFFRAYQHLGYQTYWFDDSDDVSKIDFSNSLFITAGQVDNNIPVRDDCYYIIHNCDCQKYDVARKKEQVVILQVFTKDILDRADLQEIEPLIFYDVRNFTIYMPWASDLLPYEIDAIKENLPDFSQKRRACHWVGTMSDGFHGNLKQLQSFIKALDEQSIEFVPSDPWIKPISDEEHVEKLQSSFVSPAIVGKWQQEHGYIPCRIFKSISYGNFGVTNSKEVYDLFKGNIVYNSDCYELLYDYLKFLSTATMEDLFAQMDFVRDYHTYINRINHLHKFIELVKERHNV